MKILALEFSSEQRSVAVAENRDGTCHILASASEKGGRSTRAIGLVDAVLCDANLGCSSIDAIAVGIGPGSYTGIRSAIAVAQGWQLSRNVKTMATSTMECLARQAQSLQLFGTVNIVIDAQRNEFYLAKYEITADQIMPLQGIRLNSAQNIQELAEAGEKILGPDALLFPGGTLVMPDAGILAELACLETKFIPAFDLEPIYLREVSFVKAPPSRIIT